MNAASPFAHLQASITILSSILHSHDLGRLSEGLFSASASSDYYFSCCDGKSTTRRWRRTRREAKGLCMIMFAVRRDVRKALAERLILQEGSIYD